jgi:hypothetical protein
MPTSPPYDPAADASGSSDPLGTLAGGERLAEVLLPGLTARIWRARLLTFVVVAADVADAVVRKRDDQEDLRLKARLAFERLYVSSLVRCEEHDPGTYSGVSRRVPGRRVARTALHAGDEPLTGQSFIKGQAVNGPSGVMSRLARNLQLTEDDGQVASRGLDLKTAWAQSIAAQIDTDGYANGDPGDEFKRVVMPEVIKHIQDDAWPRPKSRIWTLLAGTLRPDRVPAAERRLLARLLDEEPQHGLRPRVLQLLRDERCLDVRDRQGDDDDRGLIERAVLLEGVRGLLGDGPVDRQIRTAIGLIDAFERFSLSFSVVFQQVLWALKWNLRGTGSSERLLRVEGVSAAVHWCLERLGKLLPELRSVLTDGAGQGPFKEQRVPDLISTAGSDCEGGLGSAAALLDAVLTRHERVQHDKGKPVWVSRSGTWVLMPGTPVLEPRPLDGPEAFIHPYRVHNAYSLMRDLGLVRGVRSHDGDDGEE